MKTILATILMVISISALAHGDAEWIMNNIGLKSGSYVDASGVHCCGPSDCHRMTPEEVALISESDTHVTVGKYSFPKDGSRSGLYMSIDGDWWWCRRPTGESVPTVLCVFKPGEPKI